MRSDPCRLLIPICRHRRSSGCEMHINFESAGLSPTSLTKFWQAFSFTHIAVHNSQQYGNILFRRRCKGYNSLVPLTRCILFNKLQLVVSTTKKSLLLGKVVNKIKIEKDLFTFHFSFGCERNCFFTDSDTLCCIINDNFMEVITLIYPCRAICLSHSLQFHNSVCFHIST